MIKDRTGQKFNSLTFVRFVRMQKQPTFQYAVWELRCDCGSTIEASANSVVQGSRKQCNNHKSEISRKGWDKRGRKHGMSNHELYNTWLCMLSRCYKPSNTSYKSYGGRGIKVHEDWIDGPKKFIDFVLGLGWTPEYSIDRIDNDGNYEPSNIRIADNITQSNNTSRNKVISHNGESKTMAQWAKSKGLSYVVLQTRIQRGWDSDRALNTPIRSRSKRLRELERAIEETAR